MTTYSIGILKGITEYLDLLTPEAGVEAVE
jgi:hypothetical protein